MPGFARERTLVRWLRASTLLLLVSVASAVDASVSDDFSDGDDTTPAWSHFAPTPGGAFDASSLSYQISVANTGNALDPARALGLREDQGFADTAVAAQLVAFDEVADHSYGVVARSTSAAAVTHDGYALVVRAPGELALLRIDDQVATTLASSAVTLSSAVAYRLVLTVTGTAPVLLSGALFASSDVANPIATVGYSDSSEPLYTTGFSGLLVADGGALQDQPIAATFDDFFASAPDADTDADGLDDVTELLIGTDPSDADTDDDGLLDGFEVDNGFDPRLAGEELQDPDADGLTNLEEQAAGTNPTLPDTDGDGLSDGAEVANDFDPLDPDEDADGRIDAQDDFDADGVGNAVEVSIGLDPNLADSDGDGLQDGEEFGSGAFATGHVCCATSGIFRSAVAADIDGDGDLDTLAASLAAPVGVAWYENDGTPLVGAWAAHPITSVAGFYQSVVAIDLDGDGDLDAVSANATSDTIAWHENDGTPAVGAWTQHEISISADQATSVFAADVDGDGDEDVLSASAFDDTIAWYENDGSPALGAWTERAISTAADGAQSVTATDLDQDGDIDVLSASSGDETIAWYENDGSPLPGAWVEHTISTAADGARSVFTADLDGDGDTDVLSASTTDDTIAWYPNDGTPALGPWVENTISTAADAAWSVFAADVDGDGDTDVLSASNADTTVAWYENDGTPAPVVWNEHVISTAVGNVRSVIAADVDGDFDFDVLSAGAGGSTVVWFEQQNSTGALDPDTDDDGLLDGFEVANGFDPLVAGEQGQDPDGDGLVNLAEQAAGTNPNLADTDGDGLSDGAEVNLYGTSPTLADTDGDAALDGADNCPVTANPTQSDVGSVLDEPADGIGDACQCGDVDDSGIVDFADVDAYRDSLADPDTLGLSPAGVAKCSVIDSPGPCEILDVTVIQRALEPEPLLPGIDQVCTAAGGP